MSSQLSQFRQKVNCLPKDFYELLIFIFITINIRSNATRPTTRPDVTNSGRCKGQLVYKSLLFVFQRSRRGVDDLLSHGATILESLRDQRMTIKGIKKKVLVSAENINDLIGFS